MLLNPSTGRIIKYGGKTHIDLITKGIIQKEIPQIYRYKNTKKVFDEKTGFLFDERNIVVGKIKNGNIYLVTEEECNKLCPIFGFIHDKESCVKNNENNVLLDEKTIYSQEYIDFIADWKENLNLCKPELTQKEIDEISDDKWIDYFLKNIRFSKILITNNNCVEEKNNNDIYIENCRKLYSKLNNGKKLTIYMYGKKIDLNMSRNLRFFISTFLNPEICFSIKHKNLNIWLQECINIFNFFYMQYYQHFTLKTKYLINPHMNSLFDFFNCFMKKIDDFCDQKKILINCLSHENFFIIEDIIRTTIKKCNLDILNVELETDKKMEKYFSSNFPHNDMDRFDKDIHYVKKIDMDFTLFLSVNKILVNSPDCKEFKEPLFEGKEVEYLSMFLDFENNIKNVEKIFDKNKLVLEFGNCFHNFIYRAKTDIVYNYSINIQDKIRDHVNCYNNIWNYLEKNSKKFKVMLKLEKFSDLSLKEDDTKKKCTICMENQSIIAMLPCGHKYTCKQCTISIFDTNKKCPFCREIITDFVRIFDE